MRRHCRVIGGQFKFQSRMARSNEIVVDVRLFRADVTGRAQLGARDEVFRVVPTERVLLRTGQQGPIGGDVSRQPALGGTVATLAADAVRGGEARMMPLRTPFGMHVTAQAK